MSQGLRFSKKKSETKCLKINIQKFIIVIQVLDGHFRHLTRIIMQVMWFQGVPLLNMVSNESLWLSYGNICLRFGGFFRIHQVADKTTDSEGHDWEHHIALRFDFYKHIFLVSKYWKWYEVLTTWDVFQLWAFFRILDLEGRSSGSQSD